jgi:phage terminase large subunit-like protein
MGYEKHAVLPCPRLGDFWRGMGPGADLEAAKRQWMEFHRRRAETIARERKDPLRCGWEPSVWRIADALQGLPVGPVGWEKRTGLSWEEWCERTRLALGFERPLDMLLVTGANRSSKSERAAKRTVQLMFQEEEFHAWCFHESEAVSVEQQQKLIFRHLPPELRVKDVRSRRTYISYKEQTGFGMNHFILPNGSQCGFKFYQQDLKAHEGANLNWIWADELIGPDLMETLLSRVATAGGRMLVTFTPVLGWSATVQLILQGARVARWSRAFLLPRDGGPPDVPRALGFGGVEEMEAAHAEERWSRAEDCLGWWEQGAAGGGGAGGDVERPVEADGRQFEFVPRVMRCAREGWGALFFQPMDNPFGNPMNVWSLWKDAGREKVERRLYGWARKGFSAQFPMFDRKVHVVPESELPKEGPTVMMMDPTPGGRPFVMGWFRACRGRLYMIREWPGVREAVPGLGVLGAWAVPSGARNGNNDGARGPAQEPIGWGLRQYLLEIGRIEGWTAEQLERVRSGEPMAEGVEREVEAPERGPMGRVRLPPLVRGGDAGEVVEGLGVGARLRVEERFIDCRAASAPRMENDRPRTLQTDFEGWGLDFNLAPGGDIVDGVARVNDLLSWQKERPMDWGNSPRLFFGANCENTIYAMENWMGADGQKGACKDFVDLVRWAAVLECEEM